MRETPEQWENRNKRQFLRSTKDALGGEMWFAIKLNVIGTMLFMFGFGLGIAVHEWWAWGFTAATFVAFAVSLYWAWYIRRGINRRWEKELAAHAFSSKRAQAEVQAPPDNLLGPGRRGDDDEDGPPRQIGPVRSF